MITPHINFRQHSSTNTLPFILLLRTSFLEPRFITHYLRFITLYPRCMFPYPRFFTLYPRFISVYPRFITLHPRFFISIHPKFITSPYPRFRITLHPRFFPTCPLLVLFELLRHFHLVTQRGFHSSFILLPTKVLIILVHSNACVFTEVIIFIHGLDDDALLCDDGGFSE